MQTLAVVGIQPPEVVTRGDVRQQPRRMEGPTVLDHDPRAADDPRERNEDPRDCDVRERSDPRDVFLRDLDLPRERERVFDGDREYTLRGSPDRFVRRDYLCHGLLSDGALTDSQVPRLFHRRLRARTRP